MGIADLIPGVSNGSGLTDSSQFNPNQAVTNQLNNFSIDDFNQLPIDIQKQLRPNAALRENLANNIYGVNRKPWIFATFDDLGTASTLAGTFTNLNPEKGVVWAANPKSVTWNMPQRGVETKNKSGSVLHLYRDSLRKTYYDDPKITFSFQSGSILPQVKDGISTEIKQEFQFPRGLNNFYKFLELLDKAKIARNGTPNLIHILYNSQMFPSLVLTGFFDPQIGVQFTDDSANPNQVSSWTSTFTIYSSTPRLNNFKELETMFNAEGFTGFSELKGITPPQQSIPVDNIQQFQMMANSA